MARTTSIGRLLTFVVSALSALEAVAQTITDATPSASLSSPTSTITSAASTDSAAATQSPTDAPESLWDAANSLLSSYYPSSSITQVYSLTWPTAVVIQSSTYSVPPGSATDPATSVLADSTGTPAPSRGLRSDEKLGIGIGVAVGAVALIVLGVVLCCVHKRKKATGGFFKRRGTPSITESDVESWRPRMQERSTLSSAPSREWADKYGRLSGSTGAPMQRPPSALHPAFARQHSHWSTNSSSEENPFFTPRESPDHYEMVDAGAGASTRELANEKETDGFEPVGRRSSSSIRRTSRPPTPFSPFMMSGANAAPAHEKEPHNPFSSPEDDEAYDIVSPIIPTRSPERRHSPMVHYPSWSEVSEFDFSGSGRGRQSLRGQPSVEDGGDGWRPTRDSVYGRHELA